MTRLYFHHATSTVSGTLPNSEQSSRALNFNFDAQSVNRSMDTTIGTAQQSLTFNTTATRSDDFGYCTKFVSEPLDLTSVSANTWTYNFACLCNNVTVVTFFPVFAANARTIVTCYVWRPSTGAKVANIFDGNASNTYNDNGDLNQTNERSQHGTFSGSAVTCQAGDVIVLEMWVVLSTGSSSSANVSVYYDGTTVTSSSGTVVTNHASYLETPQTLTFQAGGGAITMTEVASKTYSNKFITKV